jgi:hypothetical protein
VDGTTFKDPPAASFASRIAAIAMMDGSSDSSFRGCNFDEYTSAGGRNARAFTATLLANLTFLSVTASGVDVQLEERANFLVYSSNLTELSLSTSECVSCRVVVVASDVSPPPRASRAVMLFASSNRVRISGATDPDPYDRFVSFANKQHWPFCLSNHSPTYNVSMDLREDIPVGHLEKSFGFGITLPDAALLSATFNGAAVNSSTGQLFSPTHIVTTFVRANPGVPIPSCYMLVTEAQPLVADVSKSFIKPIGFNAVFRLNVPYRREYLLVVNGTNGNGLIVPRSVVKLEGGGFEDNSSNQAPLFPLHIFDADLRERMKINIGECQPIVGLSFTPSCGEIEVDVFIVNGVAVLAAAGGIFFVALLLSSAYFVRVVRLNKKLGESISISHNFVLSRDPKVRALQL